MSVRLNPCFGCPVKKLDNAACRDQHRTMRDRVSGLGLRGATFTCPVLAKELRIGRRIEIMVPMFGEHPYEGVGKSGERHAKATIYTSHNGRFACVIDADEMDPDEYLFPGNFDPNKGRFRKTMRHSRIRSFLDDPDRKLCELGRLKTPGGVCERPAGEDCGCKQFPDGEARPPLSPAVSET